MRRVLKHPVLPAPFTVLSIFSPVVYSNAGTQAFIGIFRHFQSLLPTIATTNCGEEACKTPINREINYLCRPDKT